MSQNTENQFSESDVDEWFEDEEEDTEEEPPQIIDAATKYAKSQLRLVRETKEYQLDYLKYAMEAGKGLIDTAPQYQRRLRWPQRKRSLLIESFLLNIPIPPIFLFEHDYNEYEVIDGRQRLETIKSFLANNFALTGLKYWPELNRKRFNDLPNVLQKGLLRRSLSAVVLLAETKATGEDELDVRTVLFDRLNTGGVGLNPQELRNALYPGALNAALIEIARSSPFTDIWGIPRYMPGEETQPSAELLVNTLFQSMADVELVLRFFAIRDALDTDRKGSLRRILDNFMKDNAKASKPVLEGYKNEYQELITKLYGVWGSQLFRIPEIARPSRPLYDALMIALSRNSDLVLEEDTEGIKQRLTNALARRADYDTLVGRGNTIITIKQRVDLAVSILRGEG